MNNASIDTKHIPSGMFTHYVIEMIRGEAKEKNITIEKAASNIIKKYNV